MSPVAALLLTHGVIDGHQHAAAERFRTARASCFAGDGERPYAAMLAKLSESQLLAVVDVAVDQWPPWLRRKLNGVPLTAEDLAARRHLLDGLDALAA